MFIKKRTGGKELSRNVMIDIITFLLLDFDVVELISGDVGVGGDPSCDSPCPMGVEFSSCDPPVGVEVLSSLDPHWLMGVDGAVLESPPPPPTEVCPRAQGLLQSSLSDT